jgi:hypothetical protein
MEPSSKCFWDYYSPVSTEINLGFQGARLNWTQPVGKPGDDSAKNRTHVLLIIKPTLYHSTTASHICGLEDLLKVFLNPDCLSWLHLKYLGWPTYQEGANNTNPIIWLALLPRICMSILTTLSYLFWWSPSIETCQRCAQRDDRSLTVAICPFQIFYLGHGPTRK